MTLWTAVPPCVTQPPPASPHQWKTEHLLRAARLRRSARNRYGCLSQSLCLIFIFAPFWFSHGVTATRSGGHGQGRGEARHQLSFFLSFSSLFWSSPFLSFFLSFFLFLLSSPAELTDWLRFSPSFSLLFSVLYNYLLVISISNLSFSYSLFILLFQYTVHINQLFTCFI